MVLLQRKFQVMPPSVEVRNVILSVGFMPRTPVKVTEAVTDCPKVIGLGGLNVGVEIIGVALLTVKLTGALVGEARTSASPVYVALNL